MAILTGATLLFVATWKRLVDSLLIGMTGRKGVIQGGGTLWILASISTVPSGANILRQFGP
jgi:hypothetical protein